PCTAASTQVTRDDPGRCTMGEYGDTFDDMGGAGAYHFDAYEKSALGWLGGTRVTTLGSGGSMTLPVYETTTTGPLVARINASATRTYWMEYRQKVGLDSGIATGGADGVL